jgi:SAM-dependent methyltransferase
MRSSSSVAGQPIFLKLHEAARLVQMHIARRREAPDPAPLFRLVDEYEEILKRFGRQPLAQQRILEIGYGTRPFRLAWLWAAGLDVHGVDLDMPLRKLAPATIFEIARRNGFERAAKSVCRFLISDSHEWAGLAKAAPGRGINVPDDRLLVADASTVGFWSSVGRFGFIYSEDVFEHIPRDQLERLVAHMAEALRPGGLALIRPMVFTGICGGHHVDWYEHTFSRPMRRNSEPWEHLRQDRTPANTYLNRLTRANYRRLFEGHFRVLDEAVDKPGLGEQFMTPEIRRELAAYDDDELFSNSVRFVLEPL